MKKSPVHEEKKNSTTKHFKGELFSYTDKKNQLGAD